MHPAPEDTDRPAQQEQSVADRIDVQVPGQVHAHRQDQRESDARKQVDLKCEPD